MGSRWREHSRAVLSRVLAEAQASTWDLKQLKKAIFNAYPFGAREYMPYQIWLSEKKICIQAFEHKTTMAHMEHISRIRTNGRSKPEKASELQETMKL